MKNMLRIIYTKFFKGLFHNVGIEIIEINISTDMKKIALYGVDLLEVV